MGFTLCVLWTLMQLTPNPTADPAIASANQSWFPWFLAFFLCVFAATGIGNGSTYKMIPAIWRTEAERATTPGTRSGPPRCWPEPSRPRRRSVSSARSAPSAGS